MVLYFYTNFVIFLVLFFAVIPVFFAQIFYVGRGRKKVVAMPLLMISSIPIQLRILG